MEKIAWLKIKSFSSWNKVTIKDQLRQGWAKTEEARVDADGEKGWAKIRIFRRLLKQYDNAPTFIDSISSGFHDVHSSQGVLQGEREKIINWEEQDESWVISFLQGWIINSMIRSFINLTIEIVLNFCPTYWLHRF